MTATRAAAVAETAEETAWETGATGSTGPATPACNNGYDLSGKAVAVAWRNAKRMVKEGYIWEPDGLFYKQAGCVLSPLGKCYDVYLPGVYPDHPEGKCSCPFFARHRVCKHIYFGVAHVAKRIARAHALGEQIAAARSPYPCPLSVPALGF